MERLGQRQTMVGNHNLAQNATYLLFSWYQTILLWLIEILNHCTYDFIQFCIDCSSVKSTTADATNRIQHTRQIVLSPE